MADAAPFESLLLGGFATEFPELMPFYRLPWRIALPFAALVLAGSAALMIWTAWTVRNEDRIRFETLAGTNAAFMERMKLPMSQRMARQLSEVLAVGVAFRKGGQFTPSPSPMLSAESLVLFQKIPADGRHHVLGNWEVVIVKLNPEEDFVLTRPVVSYWNELYHPRALAAVVAFWLLSVVVALLVSRGLVLPLRHLAAKLPDIEKPGVIELPEAERNDEIGDVARAFLRTREALQTERTEREKAEKLAVLGRMTAALAHEIHNPVAAIKMHAQLAAMDVENTSASIIASEAERIESLVNQWMFLSKPEPPALSELDLGELLQTALATHAPQLEHAQVRSQLDLDPGLRIRADRRRLLQAFSNLIMNAVQAMPMGGRLTLKAQPAASMVEVSFNDTGKGFSSEALMRSTEFFYSEKEGGMGIGLSVVAEIVKAHRGEVRMENRPEGGACVTVL
ncbi:MAG: hypothetical protein RL693_950, partial [Verrucomicrobiota bacterium]